MKAMCRHCGAPIDYRWDDDWIHSHNELYACDGELDKYDWEFRVAKPVPPGTVWVGEEEAL